MSNQQLAIIETKLHSNDTQSRLLAALNISPEDEAGQRQAFKYASSVLEEIKKTMSDPKRDLSSADPDSICRAMIDAAQFKIPIDGRQQAHLVKFGTQVQMQIGFRGYIAKIAEYYQDADFTAEAIFEGDTLTVRDEEGFQTYSLEKADPFADGWQKLKGVLVRLSYTKGGQKFQKVTTVSKGDLEKIRKSAKQDYIWSAWPIEKAKAAAIKRACKIQFADVAGLQEMIRYDNDTNFDISRQPAAPERRSIVDNINEAILNPPTESEQPEIMDAEYQDIPKDLLPEATAAANRGVKSYTEWRDGLSEEYKELVRPHNAELSKIAKQADRNDEPPV